MRTHFFNIKINKNKSTYLNNKRINNNNNVNKNIVDLENNESLKLHLVGNLLKEKLLHCLRTLRRVDKDV